MGEYDPEQHAHQLGIQIIETDKISEWGWYIHSQQSILIRSGMGPIHRRSVLAHELVHAECGHAYLGPLTPKIETWTDLQAAKRLIDPHRLTQALAWTRHPVELSHELQTHPKLIQIYLRSHHEAG